MSKLNLSGFLNDLDKLPFTVRLLDDSGESYLIEKVLKPLLAEEAVSIDDLDFNQFDQTCIHTLIERLSTLSPRLRFSTRCSRLWPV